MARPPSVFWEGCLRTRAILPLFRPNAKVIPRGDPRSVAANRLFQEPLPPAPSPKRRGGERQGLCSPSPLRGGGRGEGLPSSPSPLRGGGRRGGVLNQAA